ncbi:MAG: S41 family peptidase [Bacteroidales bacterium]
MKKTLLLLLFIPFSYFSLGQTSDKTDFNFGFEKISNKNGLPDSWFKWGMEDFVLKTDTVEKHSGSASVRIEPEGTKAEGSFGCVAYSIPAIYSGNQIELRAYMKLQNVEDGQIGLMLRIDGENGGLQFENLQEEDIHGTSDWTLYSVKLPLPEEAKTIYIGAILNGTGKLWVDDFQLLINGEDLSKAKLKKSEEFKAQKDNEFDNGSKISTISLNPAKIEDLAILGKVWGFLKYYHPAIAKGDYNWDYELFRILPKIILSKSDKERNEILLSWIISLGEVEKGNPVNIDDSAIKFKPDLAWITTNPGLGEDLTKELLLISDSKRVNKHYYIGFLPSGNPLFKNEKPYSGDLTRTDAGYRLLSLYRYWNIIQYYFPYKNLIDEDWNKVLPEFLPKFVNATSDLDYRLTVLALIARVHDTHANIWGNDLTIQQYKGTSYAPVAVKFIENKAVVTGFVDKNRTNVTGLQIGDIIESVNNKNVDKIVEEKLPITPASNYPTQLRDIARDLLRTNDSVLNITFKRNNSMNSLTIKCYSPNEIKLYESYYKKDTCFKLITPEIACIYPGTIKNKYLPEIMKEVQKTKELIIDLRCYPSDFIVFSLGEYLMPEPVDFVKFSQTGYSNPGLFTYGTELKVGKTNNDYYKGKVVIIVNELTQSQAEYTALALRTAARATVIGSTTAGADGNVSEILLPGGIRTMISGIGVYYPDGKETQKVGIVPDIEVKPTIKGVTEGRDELLDKAIELITKN